VLAALLTLALAVEPVSSLSGPVLSDPSRMGAPWFQFAPPSGAGLPEGGPYTSAKGGVALTCTRASDTSCPTPWDTEASVVDITDGGCCVTRVGPGGYPALARYGAYTQEALRTSEFDNAEWTAVDNVAGSAVLTPNVAIAPNGTLTADRLDLPAVAGVGAYGILYNNTQMQTAAPYTASLYVKAHDGADAGTLYLTEYAAAPGYITKACPFGATWSRCAVTGTLAAQNSSLQFGTDLRDVQQVPTAALSVDIWRANWTKTDRLMPSVDATSAAVDVAETIPLMTMTNATVKCAAASLAGHKMRTSGGDTSFLYYMTGTSHYAAPYFLTTGGGDWKWNTDEASFTVDSAYVDKTVSRFVFRADGATGTGCTDGTCTSSAAVTTPIANDTIAFYLGGYSTAGYALDGWIWNVQADATPTRCR
jgi:hypothetical protein